MIVSTSNYEKEGIYYFHLNLLSGSEQADMYIAGYSEADIVRSLRDSMYQLDVKWRGQRARIASATANQV